MPSARVVGKYVRRPGLAGYTYAGYTYVGEDGLGGAYFSELPAHVDPGDVVEDDLDLRATPLQDRLAAIESELRDSGDSPAAALADAVRRILNACDPQHRLHVLRQVKKRALETRLAVLDGGREAAPDQGGRFLEELGESATRMRAQPTADARMTGSLFIMRDLGQALAAAAGPDPGEQVAALAETIAYIAAPGSDAGLEAMAEGLCRRAVKTGHADVVRRVAEELKTHGDGLITNALDGGLDGFYPPLFEAASYEMAACMMARAAAESVEDPAASRRWSKLAVNAEERFVRIGMSLSVAVWNLDGTYLGEDRAIIRGIREREGDQAANDEARDRVENQLFYPREATPILLGTEDDALRAKALRA
jgi:hypothetical protein